MYEACLSLGASEGKKVNETTSVIVQEAQEDESANTLANAALSKVEATRGWDMKQKRRSRDFKIGGSCAAKPFGEEGF